MSSGSSSLTLSVRELVEFSARTGNLSDHHEGPTSLEGIRGHQKIQKSRGKNWKSELPLTYTIQHSHYDITLQGRVDLTCADLINPIIEEIKTTYTPSSQLPDSKKHLHRSQAKVYAYLYCLTQDYRETVDVRVTWFDILAQKEETEFLIENFDQLEDFCLDLLTTYIDWFDKTRRYRETARSSAQKLDFPYDEYRSGQKNFSRIVYKAILDADDLLIEAPTGSGKTVSTLFPAVKSIGKNIAQQIVYLTAKNSGKQLAENTLADMVKKGLNIGFVNIQAKDKACPCRNDDPCVDEQGSCTRTLGFYDRLPDARLDCLIAKQLDNATLQKIADQHHLCPFELSLHAAQWCTVIICDMNYVYDPLIRLSIFDESGSTRALLIDEVHNLPERARKMYSADLASEDLACIRKNLHKRQGKIKNLIKTLELSLSNLNPIPDVMHRPPSAILEELGAIFEELQSAKTDVFADIEPSARSLVYQSFNHLLRFRVIAENLNDVHVCKHTRTNNHVTLTLFCLDASPYLQTLHKKTRCTIGFSATLTPIHFYQNSIGFDVESPAYAIESTFPPENQLTLGCDYVDTRWHRREHSIGVLVALIHAVVTYKPGKYLVYLPSYAYLEAVQEAFCRQYPNVVTTAQQRQGDEASRDAFLSEFFSHSEPILGFAILGGVFGEGVDFVGESLDGAIVVGTGMPQPNTDNKLISTYFEARGYNPFQYTYQFPGITKVLQTSGRVIRSENDRGVVLLVDPRFHQSSYSALLPKRWQTAYCHSPSDLKSHLATFWD